MPSHEAFGKMLMCHHAKVEKELLDAGVEIPKPKHNAAGQNNPGIFFWMQDDVDAVFLLSLVGAKTRGLAFRTRDAKLIEILKSTFDEKSLHHSP
ncbi:MAG TPA: hypothetical protein VMV89_12125 [Candidatus Paceibacterota bacterium]|nr:hypothetical protein [Candidatus Paceibacterota bacterium]